jgi:hypothetical protein
VNDKQVMYFVEEDDGPFLDDTSPKFSDEARSTTWYSKIKSQNQNRATKDLCQSGYYTTRQRYLKEDLLALCGQRNLPTTIEEQGVKEGWLGKQKGCSRYYGSGVG